LAPADIDKLAIYMNFRTNVQSPWDPLINGVRQAAAIFIVAQKYKVIANVYMKLSASR